MGKEGRVSLELRTEFERGMLDPALVFGLVGFRFRLWDAKNACATMGAVWDVGWGLGA